MLGTQTLAPFLKTRRIASLMRYYSRTAAGVSFLVKRGSIVPGSNSGMILDDVFVKFENVGGVGVLDTSSVPNDYTGTAEEYRELIISWVEKNAAKGLFGKDFYRDGEPFLHLKLKYGDSQVEEIINDIKAELTAQERAEVRAKVKADKVLVEE